MDKKEKQERTTIKQESFKANFEAHGNHIGKTCKAIGIHRSTFNLWLSTDIEFNEWYKDELESVIDDAEKTLSILANGIPIVDKQGNFVEWNMRPDTAAVIFTLKSKGKKRGWSERTEIDLTGDLKVSKYSDEEYKKLVDDLTGKLKLINGDGNREADI